ncbi:TetR/AcrR family transcriptional repressor of mexJK operon [Agromyces sp. 3263]|uniref:TetR/AcrR family transcriptional regulator n=1 Tax=Agromyces sp. 3263 TaxID=2817750 RepID=UPI00285AABA9|nr:TetR/AcrR family transcriptional regulator [Agromyces sp. 3263]MDR6906472.1 TetR/AcrR family transcriptional repressor of mexJK operon [Agromyces sp. 3263]
MSTQPMADRTDYEDPRITRSRALIMDAAARVFLERGYPGTSVDDIAAEAGVSKRTVYNVFDDKEQLFRAIIGRAIETAERFSFDFASTTADADDLEAALVALARELAASVLGGRVVPLRRLLIGEASRFPGFAADYYERAPGRVMAAIADALRRLGERGLLRIDDAQVAAEHFAFLAIGPSLDRALFDVAGDTDAATATHAVERAERGAAVFLRAYAA